MKTPKTYSSIPKGFGAELVTVEGDISRGLTSFNIVSLANKTIEESRERIRAAIRNSKLHFPSDRLTINLAPAGLQKSGNYLDLAIAVNILALTGQLLASDIAESMFEGELALDGRLRPVRGIINVAECAERRGFKNLYLPTQNAAQVRFLRPKNLRIIPVSSLGELVLTLKGIIQPSPRKQPSEIML
jgi:magnesium chelatase family protein